MSLQKRAGRKLDPNATAFYTRSLDTLNAAGTPFLVGGAFALERYTGIARDTKDFDVFVRPQDCKATLDALHRAGYSTELTFPHWLGKAFAGDRFIDVIFRSGNGISEVDDEWFIHATADRVFGQPVLLCPPEEMIWSKAYVQERERFDGADVAHLLRARSDTLDWDRMLRRFGPHWHVLLGHLVLFGFVYPNEQTKVPRRVMAALVDKLERELDQSAGAEKVCRGTLLSRSQYLIDIDQWGYLDARLGPQGTMTVEQVEHWTRAIAESA